MRYTLLGSLLISTIAMAAPSPEKFDQAAFEKRFHAADKAHTGKLSRQAAYAEFPRMPEFFDEIDANKDNFITITEVNRAMNRRVNAAINASQDSKRYTSAANPLGNSAQESAAAPAAQQFSSKAEAKRQYRYDYYESLAGSQESARRRGEPAQPEPYPSMIQKPF